MDYYDQISEGYEELHREEQLKKVKLIANYLKPKKTEFLLDVGCGTGITTERWNCVRIGADPAVKLLEKAKLKNKPRNNSKNKSRDNLNNKNIFYLNSEAEHLPFKDNSFDIVISITAMQNFRNIEKGIKEMKRVGKKKFILSALKKSKNINKIKKIIEKRFEVKKLIEEDKDIIFII